MTSDDSLVGAVWFTDLVGFTEFNDVMGDAAAFEVLDQQRGLIDDVLATSPGSRLVKELGDGLMVWSPVALAAVACASRFRAEVAAARSTDEFPLAVRLGIHHGTVVERGDDLVGLTVNIAARVSDIAGPGELLVSEDVLKACAADELTQKFEPIGPAEVKGVSAPVWLHRMM